jgi:hypothetical protein
MMKVTPQPLDAALDGAGSGPAAVPRQNSDDEHAELAAIKQRLIADADGAVDAETACALLGAISLEALDARRVRREILAVPLEGRFMYPRFQFQGGAVLPGIPEVLQAFNGASPWTMLSVLLDPSDALFGSTPVSELRAGRHEDVVGVAAGWGTTGGA